METEQRQQRRIAVYHLIVTLLTLWSAVNVILLSFHIGDWHVETRISNGLLVMFAVDYFVRLIRSRDRKTFLIHSAFDLMGIIPMHPVFALFRLGRLARMVQYHHLFWMVSGRTIFTALSIAPGLSTCFQLVLRLLFLVRCSFPFSSIKACQIHCGGPSQRRLPWVMVTIRPILPLAK